MYLLTHKRTYPHWKADKVASAPIHSSKSLQFSLSQSFYYRLFRKYDKDLMRVLLENVRQRIGQWFISIFAIKNVRLYTYTFFCLVVNESNFPLRLQKSTHAPEEHCSIYVWMDGWKICLMWTATQRIYALAADGVQCYLFKTLRPTTIATSECDVYTQTQRLALCLGDWYSTVKYLCFCAKILKSIGPCTIETVWNTLG